MIVTKRGKSSTSKTKILLKGYRTKIAGTDTLNRRDLRPIMLGLFGEVGSIMATVKKLHREKKHMQDFNMQQRKSLEMPYGISRCYASELGSMSKKSCRCLLVAKRTTSGVRAPSSIGTLCYPH
jgi:hypothetical protein